MRLDQLPSDINIQCNVIFSIFVIFSINVAWVHSQCEREVGIISILRFLLHPDSSVLNILLGNDVSDSVIFVWRFFNQFLVERNRGFTLFLC